MTALDEHLTDGHEPAAASDREAYRIGGLREADWAARKLRQAKDALGASEFEAAAQKAEIDEWLAHERAVHQPDIDYFTGLLTRWWQGEIGAELDTVGADWARLKTKSRRLPCGAEVAARKNPDSLIVQDDHAFLGWLLDNRPALVETIQRAKKADAKKALTVGARSPDALDPWATVAPLVDPDTGETVPGVTVHSSIVFKAELL